MKRTMRLSSARHVLAGVLLAAGCGYQTIDPEMEATAILVGTVRRGPITPVCQVGVACDEPFSAKFEIRRGTRRVATFTSGVDGAFTVKVPPGNLLVVPDATAPLMNPTAQGKPVTTQAGTLTEVTLTFDTGIR